MLSVGVDLGQQAREVRRWLHSIAYTPTPPSVGPVWNPCLLLETMVKPGRWHPSPVLFDDELGQDTTQRVSQSPVEAETPIRLTLTIGVDLNHLSTWWLGKVPGFLRGARTYLPGDLSGWKGWGIEQRLPDS